MREACRLFGIAILIMVELLRYNWNALVLIFAVDAWMPQIIGQNNDVLTIRSAHPNPDTSSFRSYWLDPTYLLCASEVICLRHNEPFYVYWTPKNIPYRTLSEV